MSAPRRSKATLASATWAGCIGGSLLYLLVLCSAVPDCTARIHHERWSIFLSGALPVAGGALLARACGRGARLAISVLLAVLFCSAAGYWYADATDNDPFGTVGNVMTGALGSLVGLIAGLGMAALFSLNLHTFCQLEPRLRRATAMLAVPIAGLLLAGSGLLPVRVTRAGLWLARHHGQGADLRGAVLYATNLTGVDIRDADLQGADLHDARLRGANLWSTCLAGADLRRANLRGVRGVSLDLRRASLDRANLSGATLTGANLANARLAGTRLLGAIYDRRTRWPAGFHPRLHGVICLEPGAKLHGANLRDADLEGDDLHGADLSGANLTGVQFNGTDLRGASLRGATLVDDDAEWYEYEHPDLSGADFRGALYDSDTRWPSGLDPSQLGAILAEGTALKIKGKHGHR